MTTAASAADDDDGRRRRSSQSAAVMSLFCYLLLLLIRRTPVKEVEEEEMGEYMALMNGTVPSELVVVSMAVVVLVTVENPGYRQIDRAVCNPKMLLIPVQYARELWPYQMRIAR